MLLTTLLVGLLVPGVIGGWVIEANKNIITPEITSNLSIECFHQRTSNKTSPKMVNIDEIRIMKYKQDGVWETVAALSKAGNKARTTFKDAFVRGHCDIPANSFLKVYFEDTSNETIGQYRCEIEGFPILIQKSSTVDIEERRGSFHEIIDTIAELKRQEKEGRVKISQDIDRNTNRIVIMKEEQDLMKDLLVNLTRKVDNLYDVLRIPGKRAELESAANWPAGEYSIPRPLSGCPKSIYDWHLSSLRVTTYASSSNQDGSSTPLHLSGDTIQHIGSADKHYLYTESCSKITPSGPTWPNGSFCIEMYLTCPEGFKRGNIELARYNDGYYDIGNNVAAYNVEDDYTYIAYCCMDHGPPSNPIILPRTEPFYLYRFGGKCQEVVGMLAYEEWILYHSRGKGKYTDDISRSEYLDNNHPDGYISSNGYFTRIELCYYVPI